MLRKRVPNDRCRKGKGGSEGSCGVVWEGEFIWVHVRMCEFMWGRVGSDGNL